MDKKKIKELRDWMKEGTFMIENYGLYRMGLTDEEIRIYLNARNTKGIKRVYDKFNKIAGVNTMSVTPDGQPLMYRHDVERFANKLFNGTETYFD